MWTLVLRSTRRTCCSALRATRLPPFLLMLEALQLPRIPGGYALKSAGLVLLADTCHSHDPIAATTSAW